MIDQSVLAQHAKPTQDVVRFLDSSHLRGDLQPYVQKFEKLASEILSEVPGSAELTNAMRKLVEAKDAAVRAKIHGDENKQ